ncbi:hypothetical protein D9M72_577190 [compost metagenome]
MHEIHGVPCAGLQRRDHEGDLIRGGLHAFGEVAYFIGDYRETATHFAGPGRFDGGVERQQVGLLGDAVNHVDHAVDFLAVLGQALNHLGGLLHAGG